MGPREITEGFPERVTCELSLGVYVVFESWLGAGNRSACILGRKRLNTGYWVFTKSLEGVKEQA